MSNEYHCVYKMEFPVDEYGRLGGLYSLVDLPIAEHKMLTRDGVIEAQDKKREMYKIRDVEKNFVRWVHWDDVTVGRPVDD